MIKNDFVGYSRFLLTFVVVFSIVLLSGCCTFTCKEVVYDFDIPEKQADCPSNTVFTVMEWQTTEPGCPGYGGNENPPIIRDGGPGVVDRDGGAGIVDRDGCGIRRFCDATHCSTGVEENSEIGTDWRESRRKEILIAKRSCKGEEQSDT